MKACSQCGVQKSADQFPNRGNGKPYAHCKECRNSTQRAWQARNRGRTRSAVLKCRYGITAAEYDALLKRQGGVCAICKQPSRARHNDGRVRRLAVDHSHTSGSVRGLLCTRCNVIVEIAENESATVRAAQEYLCSER